MAEQLRWVGVVRVEVVVEHVDEAVRQLARQAERGVVPGCRASLPSEFRPDSPPRRRQ